MRITKNCYGELKTVYEDLKHYLLELKCEMTDFRMMAVDYSAGEDDCEVFSYFDSNKKQIAKETSTIGKFSINKDILEHFSLSAETAVMYSDLTTDTTNGSKKQRYYIIFDFAQKAPVLLTDFLQRYQREFMRCLTARSTVFDQLAEIKPDILADVIKQYVDLDIIVTLSGSQYEKRDSMGSIIFLKSARDAEYKVKFNKPFDFDRSNLRLLRKLLEMSDKKLSLLVLGKKVVGLGIKDSPLRKVFFSGNQRWSMPINQRETLRFHRGKFFFDRGRSGLIHDMPKGFILKKYEKAFDALITILSNQKHGALLIITPRAKAEVDRLSSFDRGYAIDPIDFSNRENLWLVKNLASVDGAVFIDNQLKCYGTGLILDGVAKSSGSTARGARYNSSVCYLDNKNDAQYAAVIVSEDETIDIILNKITS